MYERDPNAALVIGGTWAAVYHAYRDKLPIIYTRLYPPDILFSDAWKSLGLLWAHQFMGHIVAHADDNRNRVFIDPAARIVAAYARNGVHQFTPSKIYLYDDYQVFIVNEAPPENDMLETWGFCALEYTGQVDTDDFDFKTFASKKNMYSAVRWGQKRQFTHTRFRRFTQDRGRWYARITPQTANTEVIVYNGAWADALWPNVQPKDYLKDPECPPEMRSTLGKYDHMMLHLIRPDDVNANEILTDLALRHLSGKGRTVQVIPEIVVSTRAGVITSTQWSTWPDWIDVKNGF